MSAQRFDHEMFLPDALLEGIRERAAGYDSRNEFFAEDLAQLAAAGYLKILIPTEFGGAGLSLAQASQLQRRLAQAAPATALGTNMHLVWTGVAAYLNSIGDASADFVLQEAAAGEVFAFGVSEPGNDAVLLDSHTTAAPQPDGSWRLTGTKIFTTMAPAWTRLGTFGRDDTDPAGPQLVYGFLDRADGGFEHPDDWDTLGMRATQSRSTKLQGAPIRPDRLLKKFAAGDGFNPLILGIFANFELLISSVYLGIAERSAALVATQLTRKISGKHQVSFADLPGPRSQLAQVMLELEGLQLQLERITQDFDERAAYGAAWFTKLSGTKVRLTEGAQRIVDLAVQAVGGSSFSSSSELSRLSRDVRAGIFHPTSRPAALESYAKFYLG